MPNSNLTRAEARGLLDRLAEAWAQCDPESAAACFTPDAIYMEPPDRQLFSGRDQLTAYFSPLEAGTYLHLHGFWFDEDSQTGAAEFSFGTVGTETADHGVVVLSFRDHKIDTWREYPRKGPATFSEFTAVDGKNWDWHIGNYP